VTTIQSIRSFGAREDALYALELAAAYFRANEPTSPLPLLIERARRLADLPFLEILREIAPDGLPQAQIVTGTANE
jgi:type VI secretion system protein ImpA